MHFADIVSADKRTGMNIHQIGDIDPAGLAGFKFPAGKPEVGDGHRHPVRP